MYVFFFSICAIYLNVLFFQPFQNEYMDDSFFIKIETWHKPDLGTQENVCNSAPA